MITEPSRVHRLSRLPLAVCALLVVGLAVGCSASPSAGTALTKEEFLKQGNALCAAGNGRIATAVAELASDRQAPAGATAEAMYGTVMTEVTGMIDGLRALTPPSEMQAEHTAMLAEADAVLAKVKAEGPDAFFAQTEDPFANVNAAAIKMGLTVCGESQ